MTQSMDGIETTQTQDSPQKRVKFYRHRRIVHPLLMSVGVFILTAHPFVAFLAYVISGLVWDWVVFSYKGYRDSQLLPEVCFEESGITGKQLDELNDFMVNVRRSAFAVIISTIAASVMFLPNFSYETISMFAYVLFTVTSIIIGVKTDKIICPIRFVESDGEDEFSLPVTISSSCYNAASDNKINNPFA